MPEPHWAGYVGMATGIIGAITGVAGAIMGYVSYKKTTNMKSLDLRLELRKAINELRLNLTNLDKLIDQAHFSRKDVAETGNFSDSSIAQAWIQDAQSDKTIVEQLTQNAPIAEDEYDDLNFSELESKLVGVHRFQIQVDDLIKKYNAALEEVKDVRKQIREARRY